MTFRRHGPWTLALGLLLAVPPVAAAQAPPGPGRSDADRERIEERIRAQIGQLIQDELGLTQAQSDSLEVIVEGFEGPRIELFRREIDTRRRVEALIESGAGNQEEARALVQLQAELKIQEAELFGAEQRVLLQLLTPEQLLRLQDFREDLGRRIRALGGGFDGDRGNRGGRGGRGSYTPDR